MLKQFLYDVDWQVRFSHQKAILFNEQDFISPGTKLQVIKVEPGGKIEPHYHKQRTEAILVLSGVGRMREGDEVLDCVLGDYLLCQPPTIHAFTNSGSEDFIIAVFERTTLAMAIGCGFQMSNNVLF